MICKTCKEHRGVGTYVHNTLVIHFKNERGRRDFKTKCIQAKFGWYHSNKIKHHFHITIAAKLILLALLNLISAIVYN